MVMCVDFQNTNVLMCTRESICLDPEILACLAVFVILHLDALEKRISVARGEGW